MAASKSKQNPNKWPDGTYHSIPWTETRQYLDQNRASYAKPGEVKVAGPSGFVPLLGGGAAQGNEVKIAASDGTYIPVNEWDFNKPAGGSGAAAGSGDTTKQQPFDPNLELQRLQANQNIALGDAAAAWQTGQLARSSGIDAAGNLITSGDAFSPFSQAMQYQDAFKAAKRGTLNSAGNHLYSGAYGRAQNRNALNYARDFDALKTGTQAGYYGINRDRLGTYASNAQGTGTTDFQSLLKSVYGG
jgi:hypothetical protein